MSNQPTHPIHNPGAPRPAGNWHETATGLTGRPDADTATARALLEHAAIGLLHPPLAGHTASHLALLLVDQAVAELADSGVTATPPTAVGTEDIQAVDVRRLLAEAAALLHRCTGHGTDPLAQARAAVFTRQALAALPDA